jgi:hypothetical protein
MLRKIYGLVRLVRSQCLVEGKHIARLIGGTFLSKATSKRYPMNRVVSQISRDKRSTLWRLI